MYLIGRGVASRRVVLGVSALTRLYGYCRRSNGINRLLNNRSHSSLGNASRFRHDVMLTT